MECLLMAENVLHYCKRSKNYTLNPGMEKVLKKAFIDYNAVKLPEGSFEILYAEKGNLLSEMHSSANQIIWGRRGTGKTHLLNAFVESINNNYEVADIAIYISCDRMSKETPQETVTLKNDYDKIRYFANDTFKNFMNTLCEKLFDQYEELLLHKKAAINTELQFDKYLERVGRKIIALSEICTKGVPYSVRVIKRTSSSNIDSTQRKKGLSAEAGVDKCSLLGLLKGVFNKTKSTDTEDTEKIEEETQYEHYLPSVYNAVADLLEEMGTNLYVCIDELWLIDEKSPLSFQPFFFG